MNTRTRIEPLSFASDQTAGEVAVTRAPDAPVTLPFPPKIAAAILKVSRGIQTVAKRGKNDFHKYTYAKWEDIQTELTPAILDAGLIILQNEVAVNGLKDDMIAMTYEFTIINEHGEEWPQHPRLTAICKVRDQKGVLDDKAASKCHTQAQKYFHTQLFRIRTGDMDEANHDAGPKQTRRIVPRSDGSMPVHAVERLDNDTAVSWATRYIGYIANAKTLDELKAWDDANAETLDRIAARSQDNKLPPQHITDATTAYNAIVTAIEEREAALKPKAETQQRRAIPSSEPAQKGTAKPVITDDERDWLNGLGGAFSGCEDQESLNREAERLMEPWNGKVSEAAWSAADALFIEHQERIGS